MINKLLKLSFVIVAVGLLFAPYGSAMPTDDDLSVLSRLGYFAPASPEPELSSDGKTLCNAGLPVVYVAHPDPSHEPVRIPAPIDLLTAPESATATFSITYVPDGGTDNWGEDCYAFPSQAQDAFNAAASIWGNLIQSSVPIAIRACWANLGSSSILGYSGGGYLYRDFTGAPYALTWYSESLANALAGSDLGAGYFDMHITYNLNFSWYYGTDGLTPAGQYDLMSVVLHEIAHGLNFSGSMRYSAGNGSWGYSTGYPNIYDTFMRDGSGNQLINTGVYPNPSTALGAALTSNDIWFHGSNAIAANGGVRVKMYAPSTWSGGSSYSHLDYATFNDTANELMVYALSSGESVHDPGPITEGLFKDLGWQVGPDNESPVIDIMSPTTGNTYLTNQPAINISGTASDNVGVVLVTWTNDRGGSGDASGTASWFVNGITLYIGENIITITARDAAGWTSDDILVVTYIPGIVDFDGDSLSDLAGLTFNGMIFYATDLATWTQIPGVLDQMVVGAFDGDSLSDLAGLTSGGGIWFTTNLSTWAQIPGVLNQLVVGDFDSDGKFDDLAGLTSVGTIYYTTDLSAWIQIPGVLEQLVVGDFDSDGKLDDLAGLTSAGTIYYTTDLSAWIQIPGVLNQLVVGDFDSDGKIDDLAGLTSGGTIYYTTDLQNWIQIPGELNQLVVGDFDGDGKLDDLAGLTSGGTIYYTTDLQNWTQIPGVLNQLVAGDFDGDGKIDDLAGLASGGSIWFTIDLQTWTQIPGVLELLVE